MQAAGLSGSNGALIEGREQKERVANESGAPVEASHANPPVFGHEHMMFLSHVLDLLRQDDFIAPAQERCCDRLKTGPSGTSHDEGKQNLT